MNEHVRPTNTSTQSAQQKQTHGIKRYVRTLEAANTRLNYSNMYGKRI